MNVSLMGKRKYNNNIIKSEYIIIILLFIFSFPLISCNFIIMKFKGNGKEIFIINEKNRIYCPNRIYINIRQLIPNRVYKYKFPNKILSIKLEWDKLFIHCYKMFADISNIIEIDLSQIKTTLVKSMSYLFDNCKSLAFVNLSNIDISSLINIKNIRNCKSLKSKDLTNVDIRKIPNYINIFNNYFNFKLKRKNISNELYLNKSNIQISNKQNELINDNKIRFLQNIEYCDINEIFNLDRMCRIAVDTADEDIINGMINEKYGNFLIYNILGSRNKISTSESNEIFSVSILKSEETILLDEREIRTYYHIDYSKNIYIYKHEVIKEKQIIPEINFVLFLDYVILDIDICFHINIEYKYKLPNEVEVIEPEPNGEYLCNYKKKEITLKYGDKYFTDNKNLINNLYSYICKKNCKFKEYNSIIKTLTCLCPANENIVLENEEEEEECLIKLDEENLEDNSDILDLIKDDILQSFSPEKGLDKFIEGLDNIMFQITTTENQLLLLENKSFNKNNVSIINLGECEDKLREEYHIDKSDSLIIIKYENISNDLKASEKNIQYDVFEPYNKTKLNLSICENTNVNILVKMTLSQDTKKAYDKMKEQGYDMFNINDKFYQDICTPYKTEVNTDISLTDRKDYIYNNDDTQCQPNCYFSGYSIESEYMSCECSVNQIKSIKKIVKFKPKKLYESFADVLKYSNYAVFKCYKLVFDKNAFQSNIGSIIILFYFLLYLICYIVFLFKGENPLKKKLLNTINIDNKSNNKENIIIINPTQNNNKISFPPQKKKKSTQLNNEPISIYDRKNEIEEQKINIGIKLTKKNQNYKNNNLSNYSKEKFISSLNFRINEELPISDKSKEKNKELSDYELNELEYEEAVNLDKRNFFQIYFASIKREHIILFTFFSCNDFNLLYIKIAKFIVLFATDIAMNTFFFTDETMHKIFLSYGKYDFIQQIPQIVYSTILSQILEVFLCYLSMTDKYMYQIKNSEMNNRQIMNIYRCINFKLINFFVFTFILFLSYFYIVTAFCGVYQNTQVIFIKDSFSSFLLGIIYPLFIYLIPSGFRLCSIKSKKMKYKCLYKLSDIIPFF